MNKQIPIENKTFIPLKSMLSLALQHLPKIVTHSSCYLQINV